MTKYSKKYLKNKKQNDRNLLLFKDKVDYYFGGKNYAQIKINREQIISKLKNI